VTVLAVLPRHANQYWPTQVAQVSRQLCVAGMATVMTIWCGYGFDGIGTQFGQLSFHSDLFSDHLCPESEYARGILRGIPVPLPPEMLEGLDTQQVDFEGRLPSYLRGEIKRGGWWYYYLYALMIKMPIGSIAAMCIGLLILIANLSSSPRLDMAAIILPVFVTLLAVSFKSGYTNHARYVLPCLPFLFLSASRLAEPFNRVPLRCTRGGLAVMLLASTFSAWRAYPNWLGYFNEPAGGPERGWWQLEDSNVDWGQDLVALKQWMDNHPHIAPIAVVSHHIIDESIYVPDAVSVKKASYIAIDAYSLVHDEPARDRFKIIDRVGTSFFIVDRNNRDKE
jgi:hypothetical protein